MAQPEKPTEPKGLLQTHDLYKYILDTNVYPCEPEPLKELRALTAHHPWAVMGTAPDAGQLIGLLLKIAGAKKAIEVGVFTGYSLRLTALTIPEVGKPDNEGSFDFAFVDADKINYINYHKRIMKLLKVNGIVVYDNTLWFGSVAQPKSSVLDEFREERVSTIKFNKSLAADPRVDISTVPLGDGLTICRRLY